MSMFLRRLSNPFAIWTPSDSNNHAQDLNLSIKDSVFQWQLGSKDFTRIGEDTLLRAGICGSQSHSRRVLRDAQKLGVVDPVSGRPSTRSIDSGMVNALAILSVPKQRELVMLLFFWEEEIVRWESYGEEETQLEQRLEESDLKVSLRAELKCLLGAASAKKRILPGARDSYGIGDELPAYSEGGS